MPPAVRTATGMGALLPTAAASVGKPASDDIDWDDEDEKTAIFDKHSPEDLFPGTKKPLPAAGAPATPPSAPRSVSTPLPPMPSGARPGPSMPPPPPGASRPQTSVPPPPPIASLRPAPNQASPQLSASRQPTLNTALAAAANRPAVVAAPVSVKQAKAQQGPGKMLWIALGILLIGMAAFAAVMLLPASGSIVVAVSGTGNRAIDSVQVFVDGKKLCDTSPCVANGIPAGTHFVKVQATGYNSPGAQAVKVARGDEAVLNLQLSAASDGTGLKVSGDGAGLKLFVDGKEIGALPQELKELTPGEHQIKVDSNGRFETYEESVTVVADQIKSIGPLKLKVKRGTANIEAGTNADGAKVLLVTGSEKRQIPKLPYKVDIDTSKGYQIVASKKGFATTTIPVKFDAGKDQKDFTVSLRREGEAAPPSAAGENTPAAGADTPAEVAAPSAEAMPTVATHAAAPASGGDPRKARLLAAAAAAAATPAAAAPAKTTASAPAAGQGTLNINSIPQSNVLLDGRPLGKTPRAGVNVSAGSHTVVFIHPEHGRKQVVVTVIPGRTATAAVRFP